MSGPPERIKNILITLMLKFQEVPCITKNKKKRELDSSVNEKDGKEHQLDVDELIMTAELECEHGEDKNNSSGKFHSY
jgi:hypothetical protein